MSRIDRILEEKIVFARHEIGQAEKEVLNSGIFA